MTSLFFYGTLRDLELLDIVLGRGHGEVRPATLPGYAVYWAKDNAFPMAVAENGAHAEGVLIEGVSQDDLDRLDFYEGGFAYVTLEADFGGAITARVFLPEPGMWEAGAPWSLSDWQTKWGAVVREGAREVMSYYGTLDPKRVVDMYAAILTRAQATLNARSGAAIARDNTPRRSGVVVHGRSIAYAGFFNLVETTLQFPTFSGSLSAPVNRAIFQMADAVTVVPYDPVRDRILLIEQFRVAPFERGDGDPWMMEPIAGRVDAAEDYATAVQREAQEEAGLTLRTLHEVARQYPSPGAVTEFLVSYVGICDLPDDVVGIGGLASEEEDIRSHIFGLDAALDMADSGVFRATPLLMTLYWLARHRDRLRGP